MQDHSGNPGRQERRNKVAMYSKNILTMPKWKRTWKGWASCQMLKPESTNDELHT